MESAYRTVDELRYNTFSLNGLPINACVIVTTFVHVCRQIFTQDARISRHVLKDVLIESGQVIVFSRTKFSFHFFDRIT